MTDRDHGAEATGGTGARPVPETPLAALLARRIAVDGPMPVSEWMAACLGHPEHGYYRRQDPFGRDGDFTTAPEISQVFGELLGLWCADAAQAQPALATAETVHLVELGPGRGTLMADALRALRVIPTLYARLAVHLVETSPVLRTVQEAAVAAAAPDRPVTWHDALAEVPEGPMLLLANEFFDALPIRQWMRTERGWRERLVDTDPEAGGFRFVLAARAGADLALLPDAATLPEGSVWEVCPAAIGIAAEVGARVGRHGGAALIVDYGHARPGPGETLQAVRSHSYADPLAAPGHADLTAHVDFTLIGRAAAEAGAAVHGPLPQGALLERLGLADRVNALASGAPTVAQGQAVVDAATRLAHPDAMGTLFKALALVPPGAPTPAGFGAPPETEAAQRDTTSSSATAPVDAPAATSAAAPAAVSVPTPAPGPEPSP